MRGNAMTLVEDGLLLVLVLILILEELRGHDGLCVVHLHRPHRTRRFRMKNILCLPARHTCRARIQLQPSAAVAGRRPEPGRILLSAAQVKFAPGIVWP